MNGGDHPLCLSPFTLHAYHAHTHTHTPDQTQPGQLRCTLPKESITFPLSSIKMMPDKNPYYRIRPREPTNRLPSSTSFMLKYSSSSTVHESCARMCVQSKLL